MRKQQLLKLMALVLTFALVATACGGGSDSGDEGASGTETDTSTSSDEPEEAMEDDEPADEPAPAEDVAEAGEEAEGDVDTEVEVSTAERQQGGTLVVGLEAESEGLRPWEDTCASACYNIFATIYDKLMESTADGNYEGWLFEEMTSNADFTEWYGTLRPGITFHNGVELTAQTIADMFPIQQEGSQSSSQIAASNLGDVQATGDLEVTYIMTSANSAFPAYLARAQLGFVFEPAAAAADLDGFSEAPVGTGPFKFVSRDLDNETVVERNDNYWMTDADGNSLPYLDEISFRPIPDEGTRLDAVLSGTTDVAHTLRQGTIRDGRNARDEGSEIFLYEAQGNNVGGGMFNVLLPPFDDVRVRRGLTHMNSQDNVIEALGGTGISLPGTQWFSPDSPWYSEKAAALWPQFDFDTGVSLLTEYVNDASRSDGKAVGEPIDAELSCPPDPTLIAAMQVLEQTWSASGMVNVELTNYDQQTHIGYALGSDNGFVGSHGAHCWRFSADEDPSTQLNSGFAPPTAEIAEAAGLAGVVSPLNFANYFDADMFTSLVAATRTADFDERYAIYEAVMIEIAEQTPIWYSGHTATALIADANVKGVNSWQLPNGTLGAGHPSAEGRWAQTWIEE